MTLASLVKRFGDFVRSFHRPASPSNQDKAFPEALSHMQARLEHHLVPLMLVANSDRNLSDVERATIMRHCREIAWREGMMLNPFDTILLTEYLDGSKPGIVQLDSALRRLVDCEPAELVALLQAVHRVILADDIVRAEELNALSEITERLEALGVSPEQ
jgi:hypothetical protein